LPHNGTPCEIPGASGGDAVAETSREQREKEWWDAWWGADYSWEGLARKPVGRKGGVTHSGFHGEETLQDYWRRDPATGAARDDAAMVAAGELVESGGLRFHIAHLPPKTRDGTPTWKADLKHAGWEALEALLRARIAASVETAVDVVGNAEGHDGRAQLAGAVLRRATAHPLGAESPVHTEATRSAWLGFTNFGSTRFGPGARFASATFSGDADFDNATFSGDALFDSATFSGFAGFYSATFSGDASFGSATFSGNASFGSATFSGNASFGSATFSGDANFISARFSGDALFDSATFSGVASFGSATFSGDSGFLGATFSGATGFISTTFSGNARFDRATFSEYGGFDSATFSGDAKFISATFSKDASFHSAVFQKDGKSGRMAFRWGVFHGAAVWINATFTDKAEHFSGAFRGARFHEVADFSGAGVHWIAALDDAILDRKLILDDPSESVANQLFSAQMLSATVAAARADRDARIDKAEKADAGGKPKRVGVGQKAEWLRHALERRFKELEGGCRVVKVAMGQARDELMEQRYYRFQLMARRRQPGAPVWERIFSLLYGAASDYGASMTRPFVALGVVIAVFGLAYFGLGAGLGAVADPRDAGQVAQALEFSLTNTFRPLSALSAEGLREATLGQKLLQRDDFTALGVRALSIVQSLLAIVLAFLFALAVRRRFQIS
jgi:hypothetical protein